MSRATFEVDDPRMKKELRKLAKHLKEMLPEEVNFTLFLFPPDAVFYISTVERDSGIAAIEEWIRKEKAKKQN